MITEKRIQEIKENIGKAELQAAKEVQVSMNKMIAIQKELERKLRSMLRC